MAEGLHWESLGLLLSFYPRVIAGDGRCTSLASCVNGDHQWTMVEIRRLMNSSDLKFQPSAG
jgi:hypothetical protein